MCGVGMSLPPCTPRSENPRSSARITITFGCRSAAAAGVAASHAMATSPSDVARIESCFIRHHAKEDGGFVGLFPLLWRLVGVLGHAEIDRGRLSVVLRPERRQQVLSRRIGRQVLRFV